MINPNYEVVVAVNDNIADMDLDAHFDTHFTTHTNSAPNKKPEYDLMKDNIVNIVMNPNANIFMPRMLSHNLKLVNTSDDISSFQYDLNPNAITFYPHYVNISNDINIESGNLSENSAFNVTPSVKNISTPDITLDITTVTQDDYPYIHDISTPELTDSGIQFSLSVQSPSIFNISTPRVSHTVVATCTFLRYPL